MVLTDCGPEALPGYLSWVVTGYPLGWTCEVSAVGSETMIELWGSKHALVGVGKMC